MTTEEQMIYAHKQGRKLYQAAPALTAAELDAKAQLLFSDLEQRDSFRAGYYGDRRRATQVPAEELYAEPKDQWEREKYGCNEQG